MANPHHWKSMVRWASLISSETLIAAHAEATTYKLEAERLLDEEKSKLPNNRLNSILKYHREAKDIADKCGSVFAGELDRRTEGR